MNNVVNRFCISHGQQYSFFSLFFLILPLDATNWYKKIYEEAYPLQPHTFLFVPKNDKELHSFDSTSRFTLEATNIYIHNYSNEKALPFLNQYVLDVFTCYTFRTFSHSSGIQEIFQFWYRVIEDHFNSSGKNEYENQG